MGKAILSFFILFLIILFQTSEAENFYPNKDQYIQGYIDSLFMYSYNLPTDAISVKNGYIYVKEDRIIGDVHSDQIINKLKKATSRLKFVKGILLQKSGAVNIESYEKEAPIDGIMPTHSLFHALIADPKWPRFTLAYQHNLKDEVSKRNFAPNFGGTIPIYRSLLKNDIEWEFGIQGGLFAILDVGRNPSTLINADYYISFPFSFQRGPWSGLARIYHQSSHLGDEFMLTSQGREITRVNLSFEGIDLLFSYNFITPIRIYGGGGYIVHKDPHNVKPLKVQAGVEYRSSETFLGDRLRPLTGIDIKSEQMYQWTPGVSFKTGFQIENAALISNAIQLMFEAYSGKSFAGQFYNNRIKYIGIGLHAFL